MAWIESHQALASHPKVLVLSQLMTWSVDETLGKLHRFWWWCLDYAPTGDLRHLSSPVIAGGIGLDGAVGHQFVTSLMTAHFICQSLDSPDHTPFRIHDWLEYAGTFLRHTKFRRFPEKYQQVVDFYKIACRPTIHRQFVDNSSTNSRQFVVPTNQPTNHFLDPKERKKDKEEKKATPKKRALVVSENCLEFRDLYPRRNGKLLEWPLAASLFERLSDADQTLCLQATKHYAESEMVQQGKGIRDPKRFLQGNFWREWIDPETKAQQGIEQVLTEFQGRHR